MMLGGQYDSNVCGKSPRTNSIHAYMQISMGKKQPWGPGEMVFVHSTLMCLYLLCKDHNSSGISLLHCRFNSMRCDQKTRSYAT